MAAITAGIDGNGEITLLSPFV